MSDHYDIGDLPAISRINLDGLTYRQARLVRRMMGRVIRRKCGCAILTDLTCFRCREIAELRAAFPENWAVEADLQAQIGGDQ